MMAGVAAQPGKKSEIRDVRHPQSPRDGLMEQTHKLSEHKGN
jgi:hypothetical protein